MQWFLKEQVEEVATMSALLEVVERSRDEPMDVEDYLVREHRGARPPTRRPRRPRAGRSSASSDLSAASQHAARRPAGGA